MRAARPLNFTRRGATHLARRFSAGLCVVAIFVSSVIVPGSRFFQGLSAESPAPNGAENPTVALYEQERSLVMLPLENDTRDKSLDYLSTGLIKILGGKVESVGYIRVDQPAQLIYVTPYGRASAEDAQPDTGRRYSRVADGNIAPDELQRVILNVSVRELDEETYEIVRLAAADRQAAELKADYLITGTYFYGTGSGISRESGVTRRGPVTVRLKLYNAVTARSTFVEFESPIQTIYRNLDDPAEKIRDFVAGGNTAPVQVDTTTPGAMVYLDHLYLGRTPLEGRALPGSYELRVEQEGYQSFRRRVVVDGQTVNRFRIRSPKNDHRAHLKITTDPDGAQVFLNLELIGTTPLDRADLPPGTHRLRIAKDGYIDRFIGVELSNETPTELSNETLQPGDTETHFRDPHYVIFDQDHYDIAFYSALGSLGFYAGYIHFQIRGDRIQDRLRAQLPLLSIFDLQNLVNQTGAVGVLYQTQLIAANDRRVAVERRNANISGALGIGMLLASGWFLYRGLSLDSEKESGEIGWFLRDAISGGNVTGGGRIFTNDWNATTGIATQAEIRAEPYYETGLSFSF